MYPFFLALHNLLRWLVIVAAVIVLARTVWGLLARRSWASLDDRMGQLYTISMDLQLLVGLLLFFVLSPLTRMALTNMAVTMSDDTMRFFVVEHFPYMLVAVILAHIGRVRVRKAAEDRARFRQTLIWLGLSFLIVLIAIPWPFLSYGRSLLPRF
jgi:cytochrome c biogenesis factor